MANIEYDKYIENRVLEIAKYTIKTSDNMRNTARKFGISKSTVHVDLRERLPKIDPEMARQINSILTDNKYLGQLMGGEVSKIKRINKK